MDNEEYTNLMDAMTRTSQNNAKLRAENKKLREALEFYADLESWQKRDFIGYPIALDDEGEKARETLKEINEVLNGQKTNNHKSLEPVRQQLGESFRPVDGNSNPVF